MHAQAKDQQAFCAVAQVRGQRPPGGEEGARTAKGARDVRHDCDANERYLWLDGSVPPVEGVAVGHAVTMGRFRVWRSDNVAVQATGYWHGLDGLLAEAAACL